MEYLDFELEVEAGSGGAYDVSIVRSPAGEAQTQMRLPYDQLAWQNKIQALQIALLRSGGTRRAASTEDLAVQELGTDLFKALFGGDIASRLDVSRTIARREGRGVRIKLRISAPELLGLPWEYLYDSTGGDYLALGVSTPVIRYMPLAQPIQPLEVAPPLRILAMTAGPRDLGKLDVQRERQRLDVALERLQKRGLVELEWVPGETWEDLQQALWRGPWHVFHFIGHGGFNKRREMGIVYLTGDDGNSRELSATDLARLLGDHDPLRLALLNSCETAQGTETDIFSSTAAALVRRGTPAVVAMQFEITDEAAIQFSRMFYAATAHGMPVDAAVAEARKSIALQVPNTYEWGTPVLFMRSPDGMLFRIPREELPAAPLLEAIEAVAVQTQSAAPAAPTQPAAPAAADGSPVVVQAAPPEAPVSAPPPEAPVSAPPPGAPPSAAPPPPATRGGPAAPPAPDTRPPDSGQLAGVHAGYPAQPQPPYAPGYPPNTSPGYPLPGRMPVPAGPALGPSTRRRPAVVPIVAVAIVATIGLVGLVMALLPPAATNPDAAISLSAAQGAPGSTFDVFGQGFDAHESVAVSWANGAGTHRVEADEDGRFFTSLSVPDRATQGDRQLVAHGQSSGRRASHSFLVAGDVAVEPTDGPVDEPVDEPSVEPVDRIDPAVGHAVCAFRIQGEAAGGAYQGIADSLAEQNWVAAESWYLSLEVNIRAMQDSLVTVGTWPPIHNLADEYTQALDEHLLAVRAFLDAPDDETDARVGGSEQRLSDLNSRMEVAWNENPDLVAGC